MRKALSGSRDEAEAPPTVTSGKLAALMQMLRELASEGQRVLVFSQFTAMLDLIKPELAKMGFAQSCTRASAPFR